MGACCDPSSGSQKMVERTTNMYEAPKGDEGKYRRGSACYMMKYHKISVIPVLVFDAENTFVSDYSKHSSKYLCRIFKF